MTASTLPVLPRWRGARVVTAVGVLAPLLLGAVLYNLYSTLPTKAPTVAERHIEKGQELPRDAQSEGKAKGEAVPSVESESHAEMTGADIPTIDDIAVGMVEIPDGEFDLGCGRGEIQCYRNETPTYKVTFHPFAMDKYEINQAQWQKVIEDLAADPARALESVRLKGAVPATEVAPGATQTEAEQRAGKTVQNQPPAAQALAKDKRKKSSETNAARAKPIVRANTQSREKPATVQTKTKNQQSQGVETGDLREQSRRLGNELDELDRLIKDVTSQRH
jgi:formylglycine-generating enzyme required for sulfatase activity